MAAYDAKIGQAFPGMIANSRPGDGISRIIEDATGVGFGVCVFQGTKDNTVTKTASAKFRGVTAADITLVHKGADVDKYVKGETVGVRNGGTIWVTNGAVAVAAGDSVYVTPAGGLTNVSNGGANFRCGDATFDTTAAAGALVRLSLSN